MVADGVVGLLLALVDLADDGRVEHLLLGAGVTLQVLDSEGTGGGGSSEGSNPNEAWARESPVEAGSRPSVTRIASSSPDW